MSSTATMTMPAVAEPVGGTEGKCLCLTICGYRKEGMSEEDYRHHMTKVSAPMTKDLMAKHGIVRWTQIHNPSATRALMSQLFDAHFVNVADFDCFSQVVFRSLEDYKRLREDPWYQEKLKGDHLNFADVKRSAMTIGWIEEFVRDGVAVDGFVAPAPRSLLRSDSSRKMASIGPEALAVLTGSFLAGAMFAITVLVIPVILDTTTHAQHLLDCFVALYWYGIRLMPSLALATGGLHALAAGRRARAGRPWRVFAAAAALTLGMVPFTWVALGPTNDRLFAGQAAGSMAWEEALALVHRWTMLHTARTLFPLMGAAVGMLGTLGKVAF